MLVRLFKLLRGLARCLGGHPAYVPPTPTDYQVPMHFLLLQIRGQLLAMHNDLRRVKGQSRGQSLRPLEHYHALTLVAQAHAEWMAHTRCVEHERPMTFQTLAEEEDGVFLPPTDIVARLNQTYGFFVEAGQNLARGPQDLVELMCGWKHSRKNLEVILNPHFRHAGFGCAQDSLGRTYWCALYAHPYMSHLALPDEVGLDLPEPLLTEVHA